MTDLLMMYTGIIVVILGVVLVALKAWRRIEVSRASLLLILAGVALAILPQLAHLQVKTSAIELQLATKDDLARQRTEFLQRMDKLSTKIDQGQELIRSQSRELTKQVDMLTLRMIELQGQISSTHKLVNAQSQQVSTEVDALKINMRELQEHLVKFEWVTKEDLNSKSAKFLSQMDTLTRDLEGAQTLITHRADQASKQVNALMVRLGALEGKLGIVLPLPPPPEPTLPPEVASRPCPTTPMLYKQNKSIYVPVYFSEERRQEAERITACLLDQGYESAGTFTDFSELGGKKRASGTAVILYTQAESNSAKTFTQIRDLLKKNLSIPFDGQVETRVYKGAIQIRLF